MILGYGNFEEQICCETDSSIVSTLSEIASTVSDSNPNLRNCDDLFLFEKKSENQKVERSDDYVTKFWSKNDPKKHLLKQTDKLYSHDTLSLFGSEKKSVISEIDLSSISHVRDLKFKKKIKRSLSSSSINNILHGFFSDQDEVYEQKEKIKKLGVLQMDSFNFDSFHEYLKNDKNTSTINADQFENRNTENQKDPNNLHYENCGALVAIQETSEVKENNSSGTDNETKEKEKSRKNSRKSNKKSELNQSELKSPFENNDYENNYFEKSELNKNNFSNSTDELFAHLNKKIDNLNNTNLTGVNYSFFNTTQNQDFFNHDNFYNQNNLNLYNPTKFELPNNEFLANQKNYYHGINNNNNFKNERNTVSGVSGVSGVSNKSVNFNCNFLNKNFYPSNFEKNLNNCLILSDNFNISEKNNVENFTNKNLHTTQNYGQIQKNNNFSNNNFFNGQNSKCYPGGVSVSLNSNSHIFNNGNNNLAFKRMTYPAKTQDNFNSSIEIKTKSATNYSELRDEELAKIAGIICKDQSGCRLIQKRITDNPNFANNILFPEIQNCLLDLINDAFGNYLIQKMLDFVSAEKIEWVLNLISPCFLEISCSPHGTRVIQKLIEVLYNEKLFTLFNTLFLYNFIPIAKDVNANHIVHKYVLYIKSPYNQDLYEVVIKNFVELSKDKHGCCVMQKVIEGGSIEQRAVIIENVLLRAIGFLSDQYANYVIQYILTLNNYSLNYKIAEILATNFRFFSKQKFSSNVIEKCFDHSNEEIQEFLVSLLANDENLMVDLLCDMYGNYVVQKSIQVAKGENYNSLLRMVASNIDLLKNVPFGSKLLQKFLSTYKELPSLINLKPRENSKLTGVPKNLNLKNSKNGKNIVLNNEEFMNNIKNKSMQNVPQNKNSNHNNSNNYTNLNSNFIVPSFNPYQNFVSNNFNSNNTNNNQKFYQESSMKNNYQLLSDLDYTNFMNHNLNLGIAPQNNNYARNFPIHDSNPKNNHGQHDKVRTGKKNFK